MRTLLISLMIAGSLIPTACSKTNARRGPTTTDTRSSTFSDDSSKIAFLKNYLKMFSDIEATEFHIWYSDNSGGAVPGPSEWDMQVVMKMKPENLPQWVNGLTQVNEADLSWGYSLLPKEERWTIKSKPVIYESGPTVVAVFQPESIVFKRVQAH